MRSSTRWGRAGCAPSTCPRPASGSGGRSRPHANPRRADGLCSDQPEARAADGDGIACHTTAATLGGVDDARAVCRDEIEAAEAFAAAVAVADEAQRAEIECDLRLTGGITTDRPLQDRAPARCQRCGIWALDLGPQQRAGDVAAQRGLPIRPGGMIGAVEALAAGRVIDFEHCAAGIARMELETSVALIFERVGDAHADRVHVPAAARYVVAVEDDHIAAVAPAAFEIAAGGRAVLDGRHDFEKARADRERRVDEAVFADIAVAVADREAEDVGEVGDGGLEGARDQTDLAQPQIGHGPSVL